jgi:hypothetical protein
VNNAKYSGTVKTYVPVFHLLTWSPTLCDIIVHNRDVVYLLALIFVRIATLQANVDLKYITTRIPLCTVQLFPRLDFQIANQILLLEPPGTELLVMEG